MLGTTIENPKATAPPVRHPCSRLPEFLLNRAGTRLFAILVTLEAILVILHGKITWAPTGTYTKELWRFVHLDREGNLPTWFSSTQLLLLAIVFAAIFLVERYQALPGPNSRIWGVCAVGALFLSIDEAAALHELIGTQFGAFLESTPPGSWLHGLGRFPSYYWMLIYVPLALPVAAVLSVSLWQRLGRERYAVLAGTISFLTGAVGLDYLEGRYATPDHTPLPLLISGREYFFDIILVEEYLEMIGVSLALCAFVHYLTHRIAQNHPEPEPICPN